MGIRTVAIYSDVDRDSLHVEACDEAVAIGGTSSDSYLEIDKVLARQSNQKVTRYTPDMGFYLKIQYLQECHAKIIFIGPLATAIEVMGSKSKAKTGESACGYIWLSWRRTRGFISIAKS